MGPPRNVRILKITASHEADLFRQGLEMSDSVFPAGFWLQSLDETHCQRRRDCPLGILSAYRWLSSFRLLSNLLEALRCLFAHDDWHTEFTVD